MAAATDGEGEAGQPGLELAQDRRGDPATGVAVGVGDQDDDLAGVGLGRRGDRRRGDRAGAAAGDGQQPLAPVVLGGAAGMGAYDDDAAPGPKSRAELLAPGDEVIAVVDAPGEHRPLETRGGLLRGPLGRADALDLGGDQRRDQAQH